MSPERPACPAVFHDQFRDLLRIRKSTSLLRMNSAADIKARLKFWNTGSAQVPTVIVGDIDSSGGHAGASFQALTCFINVDKQAHPIAIPQLASRNFVLHPVHLAAGAADTRAAQATYDPTSGTSRSRRARPWRSSCRIDLPNSIS